MVTLVAVVGAVGVVAVVAVVVMVGVVAVAGVVGVVTVVFVVRQDFIPTDNNQEYVNSNLREHHKLFCVSSALSLFNIDFFSC